MEVKGRNLSHLSCVLVRPQSPPLINTAPVPRLEESLSAVFPTEELISELFRILHEQQSPPLCESDLQILSTLQAPAPHLEDSTSTRSRVEPKNGENLNSGAQFKCPVCTKGFKTDKAMFGHMRIHQDKGCKGFKHPSVTKPKPGLIPDLCNKLTASWTVTKNRSPRGASGRKVPVLVPASILIDMSKSTWNGQSKKSMTIESALSEEDEEVAAILIDMPNLIRNSQSQKRRMSESARLESKKQRIEESSPSEDKKYVCLTCNKTFPSHQALGGHCSSHKMLMKNAVSLESVELQRVVVRQNSERKAKGGPHVCEICGESYPAGQQLGGHKRKHYGK